MSSPFRINVVAPTTNKKDFKKMKEELQRESKKRDLSVSQLFWKALDHFIK